MNRKSVTPVEVPQNGDCCIDGWVLTESLFLEMVGLNRIRKAVVETLLKVLVWFK